MDNLLVRCSELHKMMTKPRSKSEEISATTKTWLKEKVKQEAYGYRPELNTKPVLKGIHQEQDSIDLLNDVTFNTFEKNERRENNGWLTGLPDIITTSSIRDIKSSWTLDTFPAFQEDGNEAIKKAGYDWQLRGYMMLFEKPEAYIHYCMVTTKLKIEKEDGTEVYLLSDWDDVKLHQVDHIEPSMRITTVEIKRDKELEEEIKAQYEIANKYYQEYWKEISKK